MQRWVVVKCEANAQGTNRRAVVSNRVGATILPGAADDGDADRGESQNRNKELKVGLLADRLSDHRYFANLFRLYLHTTAYNLLVHMRRAVADPPQEARSEEVPVEAFAGRRRARLAQPPSGTRSAGRRPALHMCTRPIKVAAPVAKRRVAWWWNSRPVGPIWTTSSKSCDASWPILRPPRTPVDAWSSQILDTSADFRLWGERGDCVCGSPCRATLHLRRPFATNQHVSRHSYE